MRIISSVICCALKLFKYHAIYLRILTAVSFTIYKEFENRTRFVNIENTSYDFRNVRTQFDMFNLYNGLNVEHGNHQYPYASRISVNPFVLDCNFLEISDLERYKYDYQSHHKRFLIFFIIYSYLVFCLCLIAYSFLKIVKKLICIMIPACYLLFFRNDSKYMM